MNNVFRVLSLLFVFGSTGCGFDDGGGGKRNNNNEDTEGGDVCGNDRSDGNLGDVCRVDCDCAVGFNCYTDDYSEQCCAEDLNDLDNGVWGIDCDGRQ